MPLYYADDFNDIDIRVHATDETIDSAEEARRIIDANDEDETEDERVHDAWQYLFETEAYLDLPPIYGERLEEMVELGIIG